MRIACRFIFVPFIFMILNSCRKANNSGTASHGVFLHFIDSTGRDLFTIDSSGKNGYYFDSIYLYDITQGKTVLNACYEDGTKNYLFQALDELRAQFCPNLHILNRYSSTLVQLKRGQSDTLICHINTDQMGSSTNYDSVWYNRTLLKYDGKGNLEVTR